MKRYCHGRITVGILILTAVLCLCAAAFAETSGDCSPNGDNSVTWTLTDDGTLTIKGNGPMKDYASYYQYAPWSSEAKRVVIEAGVTSIGDCAFFHYSNSPDLEYVKVPSTLTKIGKSAFYKCSNLPEIRGLDGVEFVGFEAFYKCKATLYASVGSKGAVTLSKADLSFTEEQSGLGMRYEFNEDQVTGLAVKSCSKEATSVTVPDTVTRISEGAFSQCVKLASIKLPNSLKHIERFAFEDCDAMTTLVLPSGLETLSRESFFNCSALKTITIPDGITTLETGTFAGCNVLETVHLPATMTAINEAAFYHCRSMKSISLPAKLTSIGRLALADCGLTEIVLPESVTKLEEYVFHNDPELVSVRLTASTKSIPFNAFNKCKKLAEITIPNGVTTINSEAFTECTALKKVMIPDSVKEFGEKLFKGADNAVIYCSKGSPADIYATENNIRTSYTGTYTPPTTGGDVEAGKSRALSSGFDATSVGQSWEKPYAVSSNEKVLKVTGFSVDDISTEWIKFTVTVAGVKPGVAFVRVLVKTNSGDIQVWKKTIIVSGTQTGPEPDPDPDPGSSPEADPSVPTAGGAALSLNAGSGTATVTGTDGSGAGTINIPDSVTVNGTTYQVTGIAANAFKNQKKITKVTIGKNVKTIGKNAFSGCTGLKAVAGMAGLVTIGDGAFQKCTALKSFTIVKTVTKIGKNAFSGCKKLAKITIKTAKLTKKTIGKNSFKGIAAKAVFKCPKKQKKDYAAWLKKPGGAPKTAKFK